TAVTRGFFVVQRDAAAGSDQLAGAFFAAIGLAAGLRTAVFLAAVLAAVFAAGLAAVFAAVLAAVLVAGRVATAVSPPSPPSSAAAALALAPGLAARGSNSKLILPSLPRTRKALNGRRVRCETKPGSKSVLPSFSSLAICSGRISCCRMMRPLRKLQVLGLDTLFSHT